ncbi:hypothetical protein LJR220_006736 [Bradyrhizobium sp. LjRoot220]|uniref:hypothetical protein n=1 Tax=Bradyrhizobium sp. LjRoot220 TaxID=3342284 RepID=UPI003ECEBA16
MEKRKSSSGTRLRETPVVRVGKPDRNAAGASRDIAQCLELDQDQGLLNVVSGAVIAAPTIVKSRPGRQRKQLNTLLDIL